MDDPDGVVTGPANLGIQPLVEHIGTTHADLRKQGAYF
jgi:hypothetical protein